MLNDFQSDIDVVRDIDAVSTILDVVCRTTGMGFAAVARVTENRWVVCEVLDQIAFGLRPGGELDVTTTICNEIRKSGEIVVIDHVSDDKTFCRHPTPAMYGFQSYISVPIIRADGTFFGTLCAIDPRPARLKNPETVNMFKLFAQLIASQLDANDRVMVAEKNLKSEQAIAEIRERFIGVLGHDLRNPLFALEMGTQLLTKSPLNEKSTAVVTLMQGSIERMNILISDMLDFARSRLGEGIALHRTPEAPINPVVEQIIEEFRFTNPKAKIKKELQEDIYLNVDIERLSQVFSNLISNAVVHGDKNKPILVNCSVHDGVFEFNVTNEGKPIPSTEIEMVFMPFSRGKAAQNQDGLGLGLYIASEIARSHDGTIGVDSSPDKTSFAFRMSTR